MNEEEWDALVQIRNVFEDCYIFTKRAQSRQMTVSDFYAEWIDMKLKLKNMPQMELVEQLLYYMEQREFKFMESPVTLSALFLDTRYRVLLKGKTMASQTAMNHLACLWKRIRDLKSSSEECSSSEIITPNSSSSPIDNTVNVSEFERYLD